MKHCYALLIALLVSFTINAQIVDIPDANFKALLTSTDIFDYVAMNEDGQFFIIDTNADGEIQVSEASLVYTLRVRNSFISDLTGIESFTNLTLLQCYGNQLTTLDVSQNMNLIRLDCYNNQLSSLDLNSNLEYLDCSDNSFISLDVSEATNLEELRCPNNEMTNINVSQNLNLRTLWCHENSLSSINLTQNIALFQLRCDSNNFTTLSFEPNINLFSLTCGYNPLQFLDLSFNTNLRELGCYSTSLTHIDLSNNTAINYAQLEDNQLISINIKNGTNEEVYLDGNLDIEFICVDEDEMFQYQSLAEYYGFVLNSYCSFVPGGELYTIEGSVKIDSNTNGCDTNDAIIPHLNFAITNGTETGNFISYTTEDYSILVGEGTYTITPVLENPSYFTITPSSLEVNFPTDTSPFMQDFCVTANGVYKDIDIQILPLTAATPGFQSDYRIIYKNTGNTLIDFGQVLLTNDFDLMSEVSFNPSWDSFTFVDNAWHFNFEDLQPFETRTIDFSMLINTPMDTPAVNGGDILTFNANYFIEYELVDPETAFVLEQTVVNSYDPNDKTCLEGEFITPEQIGEFVHYMIRFENTGTANAVNVVVKDNIDITKYDLLSIVPLHASHDYFAKVKNNATDHYIEFIFENINLPFDDANNDGYIVFKIKTLDTLALNDTFENEAEIYFDFNFPIITNNEQTTITTLSTDEFDLANNTISLYPNPTTHSLHLESKQAIKQITIYDTSGRSIKEIAVIGTKTELTISTEELSTGTYFVKIKTESSEFGKKIIKK